MQSEKVENIVNKAKLAAAKLGLLLHAQNCRIGVNCCCPHAGCYQAKLLLLHMKTCPAKGPNCTCCSKHQGCDQARKLLDHYKKCRVTRRARVANRCNSSALPKPAGSCFNASFPSCLICSMLSRQAKGYILNSSRNKISGQVCGSRVSMEKRSKEGSNNKNIHFGNDNLHTTSNDGSVGVADSLPRKDSVMTPTKKTAENFGRLMPPPLPRHKQPRAKAA